MEKDQSLFGREDEEPDLGLGGGVVDLSWGWRYPSREITGNKRLLRLLKTIPKSFNLSDGSWRSHDDKPPLKSMDSHEAKEALARWMGCDPPSIDRLFPESILYPAWGQLSQYERSVVTVVKRQITWRGAEYTSGGRRHSLWKHQYGTVTLAKVGEVDGVEQKEYLGSCTIFRDGTFSMASNALGLGRYERFTVNMSDEEALKQLIQFNEHLRFCTLLNPHGHLS